MNTLLAYRTRHEENSLFDPQHVDWADCERATIDRFWNGRSAIREKGYSWNNLTRVCCLWNDQSVIFYFRCWFETLNIHPDWKPLEKIHGLWERDVVEVFIRPPSCDDYFEIEVSPAGQWLNVHVLKPRLDMDFSWDSHLKLKVEVTQEERIWRAFVAIPFQPIIRANEITRAPQVGESWRLNLYRIAGEEPDREFLAWRPTHTAEPDFHVPSSFGNLIFLDAKA